RERRVARDVAVVGRTRVDVAEVGLDLVETHLDRACHRHELEVREDEQCRREEQPRGDRPPQTGRPAHSGQWPTRRRHQPAPCLASSSENVLSSLLSSAFGSEAQLATIVLTVSEAAWRKGVNVGRCGKYR